ncbi:MAG: AAA domain-containing protein [Desulfobulbaceae bacterium]|nr:AAA domain-containing protein [Desulfobulbaceae bacterium]
MKKRPIYPFAALVGQENMQLALLLNVINPGLSGVLIRGEKGTAKSTAVRALADILPEIAVFADDPYQLNPDTEAETWRSLRQAAGLPADETLPAVERRKVRVVELPVGATEDRVVGTLDLEQALKAGEKRVEPGILAQAHRNILYVDEVNLLDDHVVDVLLDSAAMGVNTIEREGISFSHPARFTLVGTMNPEEGELRPQLLDRFGLCVTIEGLTQVDDRVAIMERRAAFDTDAESFAAGWQEQSAGIAQKIVAARALYPQVEAPRELLFTIARTCLDVGVDGHRGDIIMLKCAKTLAALAGRKEANEADVHRAAELVLPHRLRRQPLMEIARSVQDARQHNLQQQTARGVQA